MVHALESIKFETDYPRKTITVASGTLAELAMVFSELSGATEDAANWTTKFWQIIPQKTRDDFRAWEKRYAMYGRRYKNGAKR